MRKTTRQPMNAEECEQTAAAWASWDARMAELGYTRVLEGPDIAADYRALAQKAGEREAAEKAA